jgi:hypothetical protein
MRRVGDNGSSRCGTDTRYRRAVRCVPMSNAESHAQNAPTAGTNASGEPDLAQIERDLAEIELMLERLD